MITKAEDSWCVALVRKLVEEGVDHIALNKTLDFRADDNTLEEMKRKGFLVGNAADYVELAIKALRKNAKAVEGNTAAKKIYDDFHGDLLLWTALQEYSV
jgi:hypothetical protein